MLHFEGDRDLSQTPAEVWTKLSDARFLVQCIPGVESTSQLEPATAICVVRPAGLSFVSGTIEMTIQRTAAVENISAQVMITTKSIGAGSEVETAFTLAAHESGTRLHWMADIKKLTGLVKHLPTMLLKGAAQKIIADVWDRVVTQLNGSSPSGSAPT